MSGGFPDNFVDHTRVACEGRLTSADPLLPFIPPEENSDSTSCYPIQKAFYLLVPSIQIRRRPTDISFACVVSIKVETRVIWLKWTQINNIGVCTFQAHHCTSSRFVNFRIQTNHTNLKLPKQLSSKTIKRRWF